MAELHIAGIDVVLDRSPVLSNITATVPDGAFAAVVGPSGSGKSTLLRVIAGLVDSASGSISYDDVDVTDMAPGRRDVGMVFQTPVLFSHRSVRGNVSFPLEIRRDTIESIRQRVDAESRAMQIEHLLQRNPDHLSRGEQQLVQIARTMVRAPRVLLLDEPFAPLDEHLRRRMRAEIKILQAGYGVTTLMATNDPDDVSTLASHVIVLGPAGGVRSDAAEHPHTVIQAGERQIVADNPTSLDVAAAMGPLSTLRAHVEGDQDGYWITTPPERGALRYRSWAPALDDHVGAEITVGFGSGDLVADERGELTAVIDRVVPGVAEPLVCHIGRRTVFASTGELNVDALSRHATIRLRVRRLLVFENESGRRLA